MNLQHVKSLATALALTGALSACKPAPAPEAAPAPPAAAADATPATAPMADATHPPKADATQATGASTDIPDTADAIWQQINIHCVELKATIDGGALGEVHHHAFAIRDLVAALPSHSPNLSAEDQAKLQGQVKFVSTLADRLDASGDGKDQAGSKANYDQLMSVLSGITRTK